MLTYYQVQAKQGFNKLTKFIISQYRLRSLEPEQNLANQLKTELEQLFNGPIPVSATNWATLVNAYVYGGYPSLAIYKAIIFGGKTVHPIIPWSAWQNSDGYKQFIYL